MSKNQHGLGKGLGALLPKRKPSKETQKNEKPQIKKTSPENLAKSNDNSSDERVAEISVMRIWPNQNQPRHQFDERALEELKDSIVEHGVLQPIIVRKVGNVGSYEIIAGERRFRAAKMAGLKTIPAIVRDYSREKLTEIALIENLQREDLNVIEEAKAYDSLMDKFNLKQADVAKKIGRSRSHIANIMRLLSLPEKVQSGLIEEVITMGQAKPLLSLEDAALMQKAADFIVDNHLSSRESEELVSKLKKNPRLLDEKETPSKAKKEDKPRDIHVVDAEERMANFFGTKVKIIPIANGKKKSKIEIEYYSDDDISRILDALDALQPKSPAVDEIDDIERKKELLRKASKKFTV